MADIFFGTPPGVKEGQIFGSRAELRKYKLHRYNVHGIDGNGTDGASAIVLSGGYEDDEDIGDFIIYTGHGGNDEKTKKQVDHQSWESPGNKGLVVSQMKQLPVRVIRSDKHLSEFSPKSGYRYGGMYRVVESWDQRGKSGFKICRYKLVKENICNNEYEISVKEGVNVLLKANNREAKWFSVGISGNGTQRISTDSKMAKSMFRKKVGDIINFGDGFKILEIRI